MKTIPNYFNYLITKNGQIWSKKRKRWLNPYLHLYGYKKIDLSNNQKRRKSFSIHRLVLETYIGKCPKGLECRHLNGIKTDNRLKNLCWGNHTENTFDSIKHNVHNFAKLTEQNVRMIIYMYKTNLFFQKEIAKIYDITSATIYRIVNKRNWKHLWCGYCMSFKSKRGDSF